MWSGSLDGLVFPQGSDLGELWPYLCVESFHKLRWSEGAGVSVTVVLKALDDVLSWPYL